MSDVLIIGVWGVIMALLRADALEVEGSIGVREVNHDFALLAEVSLGIIPGGERGFGDGLLLADHLALEEEFAGRTAITDITHRSFRKVEGVAIVATVGGRNGVDAGVSGGLFRRGQGLGLRGANDCEV